MANKPLKIGLFNAGSLGTNHDNLVATIRRHCVDVLAINETWLRVGEEGRAPSVAGYYLRHRPRAQEVRSRGGGVGYYIKRGVNARTWDHPVDPLHKAIEQMWLTLTICGRKIVLGTAYRPPWLDVDVFLDALTDTINAIPGHDYLVLVGDFNINMLSPEEIKTNKLSTFLSCLGLSQLVSTPTHFTETSQTLIDVICSNLPAKNIIVEHVGSLYGHCFVTCEFNIKREKIKPYSMTYRPIKHINIENFNSDLEAIQWSQISTLDDVNEMVNIFNHSVLTLFDTHAPLISTVIKTHSYPWITDTIKLMMKLRDKASAEYHKTKSDSKKEYYKCLKSTVNKALFNEKSAYYKHNINNKINNPKLLWKNIKTSILPKKNIDLPPHFNDPNVINNHFINVPGLPSTLLSYITYFEFHNFSEATFHLKTVTVSEIIKFIKLLKSKAEGCDSINLEMLLLTMPDALETITSIVNASIVTSTFPDAWKTAVVRPLPKISNPTDLKDLRPISILPCLSKILEKAVSKQITVYLEKNNMLPEVQSGFRRGRSTVTALLDVTDNILQAQDQGMCTLLVLLDFSRAFDSLNINLLLSKLSYYGFDSNAIQWFHSYLSERYQYVKITNYDGSSLISDRMAISKGVPQGSILGPILFLLYSADMKDHIMHCRYHFYADDTQIYISCKPSDIDIAIDKLNEDLNRISLWSRNNSLLLNPNKSKYMICGTKSQISRLNPSNKILIMGQPIERVWEARNLGLQMDCDLRFENHIIGLVRDCFYRLKILYNVRDHLGVDLRIRLTESLILSKLNYTDIVYGPRLTAKTQRLVQRIQNACARFCFDIPFREHVTPYLNVHSILKMKHRRKFHLACLLFDLLRRKEPSYLYNKLTWMSSHRTCESRQCSIQLVVQKHKTASFRGSFRYAASRCWNNIPPPIRNTQSFLKYKSKLKEYILRCQQSQENFVHDVSVI